MPSDAAFLASAPHDSRNAASAPLALLARQPGRSPNCAAVNSMPDGASLGRCRNQIAAAVRRKTAMRKRATRLVMARPLSVVLAGSGDERPVRIARSGIAREGPHIGHVAHRLGIAFDDGAVLFGCGGNVLRFECDGDFRR